MKIFFMVRKSQLNEVGLLHTVLVAVLCALLSTSQTLVCWPRISDMPGLPLIKKTCESAENTVLALALRGSAKIIETSNDHKMLGITTVALAAVGAGYLVSRPYVWANERAKKAEYREVVAKEKAKYSAALAEKEIEISKKTIEEYELTLQNDRLANSLGRAETERDCWMDKAGANGYEREYIAKQVDKLISEKFKLQEQVSDLEKGILYYQNGLNKLQDTVGNNLASRLTKQDEAILSQEQHKTSEDKREPSSSASHSLYHISTAPEASYQKIDPLRRSKSEPLFVVLDDKDEVRAVPISVMPVPSVTQQNNSELKRTPSEESVRVHEAKDEDHAGSSMENALKYARAQNILIEASKKA
jgi:hypothetical protein